jgi:tRNA threonylcarbamoyl adenosine modification protein YjeE
LGAWFYEGAHEEADDAADDRSDDCDEEELASDAAAMLPEREESHGDEKGFENGCDDGCEDARYDTDQNVICSPPPHLRTLRFTANHSFKRGAAVVIVADTAALEVAAAAIARELRAGDAVGLDGDLGAGKTTLVAALVRALGNDAEVSSPTFTFWHRYGGTPPLEHLDLYRIGGADELVELGLEEAFTPEGIAFVEWAERFPELLPAGAVRIRLSGSGDGPRELEIVRPPAPGAR